MLKRLQRVLFLEGKWLMSNVELICGILDTKVVDKGLFDNLGYFLFTPGVSLDNPYNEEEHSLYFLMDGFGYCVTDTEGNIYKDEIGTNKGNEMELYVGTKLVNSKPMNRQEYNDFRGWELPADENGSDEGFLVEYLDGGQANTEEYEGYVSWSPKTVFDKAYASSGQMSFGAAIELMKAGKKVARTGWNGKGMWLILVPGSNNIKPVAGTPYSNAGLTGEIQILPHIDMYTTDSTGRRAMLPGWLASQSDVLATDWTIVE